MSINIINEDAIMMSIHPWWIHKMNIGEKTWEIRSRCPKVKLPCKVYVYCTKSFGRATEEQVEEMFEKNQCFSEWGGKVVAEFTIDCIESFHLMLDARASDCIKFVCNNHSVEEGCCVPKGDLHDYIGTVRPGYALRISNFKMLPHFQNYRVFGVNAAPQYYCKVSKGVNCE